MLLRIVKGEYGLLKVLNAEDKKSEKFNSTEDLYIVKMKVIFLKEIT